MKNEGKNCIHIKKKMVINNNDLYKAKYCKAQ